MNFKAIRTSMLALPTLMAVSCVNPTPNTAYFGMDPAQAEANRQNTNRIQQEDRDMDHVERMRRAHAHEISTRNAPTHVSTTSVYAPSYWGW